jgi:Cu2+-containing amine oxidase
MHNHRHHVYWRFDFDIDGSRNDLVLEHNTYTVDAGWGPGWFAQTRETKRWKNPSSQRSWAIMEKGVVRGYHVLPGPNDGTRDAFSTGDLWVLRYHADEDRYGQQGSASNDQLGPVLGFVSTGAR